MNFQPSSLFTVPLISLIPWVRKMIGAVILLVG